MKKEIIKSRFPADHHIQVLYKLPFRKKEKKTHIGNLPGCHRCYVSNALIGLCDWLPRLRCGEVERRGGRSLSPEPLYVPSRALACHLDIAGAALTDRPTRTHTHSDVLSLRARLTCSSDRKGKRLSLSSHAVDLPPALQRAVCVHLSAAPLHRGLYVRPLAPAGCLLQLGDR